MYHFHGNLVPCGSRELSHPIQLQLASYELHPWDLRSAGWLLLTNTAFSSCHESLKHGWGLKDGKERKVDFTAFTPTNVNSLNLHPISFPCFFQLAQQNAESKSTSASTFLASHFPQSVPNKQQKMKRLQTTVLCLQTLVEIKYIT